MIQEASGVITIDRQELKTLLYEVVRAAVRDELVRPPAGVGEDWDIEEGSVLWEDLTALRDELRQDRLHLLSHEEVFGK